MDKIYIIIREEECWWWGRSRLSRLHGLNRNTGDCARGRDWNPSFLLFFEEVSNRNVHIQKVILDDDNTKIQVLLQVVEP